MRRSSTRERYAARSRASRRRDRRAFCAPACGHVPSAGATARIRRARGVGSRIPQLRTLAELAHGHCPGRGAREGARRASTRSSAAHRRSHAEGHAELRQGAGDYAHRNIGERRATARAGAPQHRGEGSCEHGQSVLGDGIRVSAETSRRIACDCTRVVMTHDANGNVLDGPDPWCHVFQSFMSLRNAITSWGEPRMDV
jgi:hypothetical protein